MKKSGRILIALFFVGFLGLAVCFWFFPKKPPEQPSGVSNSGIVKSSRKSFSFFEKNSTLETSQNYRKEVPASSSQRKIKAPNFHNEIIPSTRPLPSESYYSRLQTYRSRFRLARLSPPERIAYLRARTSLPAQKQIILEKARRRVLLHYRRKHSTHSIERLIHQQRIRRQIEHRRRIAEYRRKIYHSLNGTP